MTLNLTHNISRAAKLIKHSRHTTVFTGAGISVESGIPPFRGEGGLWNKYDPNTLDISYFLAHPKESWEVIKEIFYDFFGKARPNDAHKGIVRMEQMGFVKAVITQNVDNMHQLAGSQTVFEFHGTSAKMRCLSCQETVPSKDISLNQLPPRCSHCSGIMKPDFIFFGEGIPRDVSVQSFHQAQIADVFLVIGSTGEVMPACQIPFQAHQNGAKLIEINLEPSHFTNAVDIFLQGKATEIMNQLVNALE